MTLPLAGRRVLLIGGAGFIGHNMALALKAQGAHVDIVDGLQVNNLTSFVSGSATGPNHALYLRMIYERLGMIQQAGIPLHVQDARDYHAITRIVSSTKPNVIVHLAAISHAGRSNKDPYSTFDHSLRTLENTLDAARDVGVEQFIFFSSSMVYGNFLTDAVNEDHPLNPIGIYGALKVSGEKIVIAYQQVFNLPYTIIRPSALYGARCVSRRVVQIFIENALAGEPLRVDGDGAERLDFTYIDDLIAGISLAIQNPNARNQIFNLTYGGSRSIQDLVHVVKEHFPEVKIDYVERDRLMPFRGTLSVDKAREMLNYDPQFPLEAGVGRYVAWYKDFYPHALAEISKNAE